jgi:uncharacterized protein with HEPN domain
MPPERDAAYIFDMLEAARAIGAFVEGSNLDGYRSDLKLRSAVERQFEILGEAARHVSTELREAHAEIPWRAIVGQRNILAHDYGEIDDGRVWQTATEDLPRLIGYLERLLPRSPAV